MARLRANIAISLDGYAAGPDQSEENPLGKGGMQLHEWVFELAAWRKPHGLEGGDVNASSAVVEEIARERRRDHHGPEHVRRSVAPWGDQPWNGWWGDDPPFHTPVFIVTHHPREPLVMQGGTTFTFVTDGIESALAQAMHAAGGKDVSLAGGASVIQQYLKAGLLDELQINLVPVLLGGGERLLDNVDGVRLEQVRVVEAPGVTHLAYRRL